MEFYLRMTDKSLVEAAMDDNCIPELCDPENLTAAQAIRLAREVSRAEPGFAPTLGAYLYHLANAEETNARMMQRALEVLYAIADPRRFEAACQRVQEGGNPVASAMVRWLVMGIERRHARFATTMPPPVLGRATLQWPLQS